MRAYVTAQNLRIAEGFVIVINLEYTLNFK